ncbi:MAG: DUF4340 domain-containing protein [Acidobacteria bacterium]|nr:DUF4340 domain-containing protein [Acidobacteriota bacterium]
MRSGRSFLLMLVVAAGLGGYIYFVEMKRDPAADTATTAREKVFTIQAGTIEDVEITNATSQVVRVSRKDAVWSLVAPEAPLGIEEADTAEVTTVISSLESLERVKVIDENPATVAPFGLAPARIKVAFKTAGDATQKVLLIGNKTPTGGDLYAKLDNAPGVFLIGAFLEDTFNRKSFDLREKTALKFTREAVDSITLAQGTTRVTLAKTGSDWRFSGPNGARADAAAVDALIGQLAQARMTSIAAAAASTAKPAEYGLDKPQVVATIGAGSTKAEIAIGKKEDDTHFFARDLSRPLVFGVDKTLLDELLKKADDFRVKDVFAYRSFTATGMDVAFAGQTHTFAKKKAEGETSLEKWWQTAPASKELESAKFDDFLMTMSNLRAESFAATAHTGGEAITITARFGDAAPPQTETVTLRKVGTVVHAIRAGEPGAAVVSTADFDRALGLFKELTSAK